MISLKNNKSGPDDAISSRSDSTDALASLTVLDPYPGSASSDTSGFDPYPGSPSSGAPRLTPRRRYIIGSASLEAEREPAGIPDSEPSNRIRVLIAAESKTTARSMSAMLSDRNEFMVIGTATTFNELDATLHLRTDVDVLVTDVELGGATVFSIIEKALVERPNLNVLCYTNRSEPNFIMNAIRAGALGYVLQNSPESLDNCVRLINGGGSPMSPAVTRHVLRAMQMTKEVQPLVSNMSDVPELSTREREILELLAKGIPFAEIGTILMISPHTVTAHIKKIYRKLQVQSRGEAVYEARALRLISDS